MFLAQYEEDTMIIRARTFKDWMRANFDKSELADLANRGAVNGFPGLSYYRDTCKLYNKFKDDIWEMLIEEAESFGHSNVFEMIAYFGEASNVCSSTTFENLMTWFAAEKYAREQTEGYYN